MTVNPKGLISSLTMKSSLREIKFTSMLEVYVRSLSAKFKRNCIKHTKLEGVGRKEEKERKERKEGKEEKGEGRGEKQKLSTPK